MTTEEFIKSYGTEVHQQKFENIGFEITEIDEISFSDCEFYKCQICFRDVKQMQIFNCKFGNSLFLVSLNDPEIYAENCSFNECNFDNVEIEGFSFQSEIVDADFYKCTFKQLVINSDISVLGGKIGNSKTDRFEGKINMLMDLDVSNCIADDIQIDAAVLKCKFDNVEIKKLIHQGKLDNNTFTMFNYNQ